ncbi:MAG: hypothetical protein JWL82_97 [Parcubacteria group bacterium]|nr:hypothetical protein [Parcubacteria group bacterium]
MLRANANAFDAPCSRGYTRLMNYSYSDLASISFLHPLGLFLGPILAVVLIWVIFIKGFALWKSARNGHKVWFIVLLIANTLGLLELIYLIWFNKPRTNVAPVSAPAPAPSAGTEA